MSNAAVIDYEVHQGAHFAPLYELQDDAGEAIDLTDAPARFTVRKGPTSGDVLFWEQTRDAGLVIDDAAGSIQPVKTGAETMSWDPGLYYYALNVTIGGLSDVYATGTIKVAASVANPA